MRQNSIMPFKPKYLKVETFVKNHPMLFREKSYFKLLMCAAMELDGPNRERFAEALWKSVNKDDSVKFYQELENALVWAVKKICFAIHWSMEPFEEMNLLDIWLEVYPSIIGKHKSDRIFQYTLSMVFDYMTRHPETYDPYINIKWKKSELFKSTVINKG